MTIQYPPLYNVISILIPASVNIVWANQGGAMPDKPYISLKMGTVKSPQDGWYGPLGDDGSETVSVDEEAMVEIEAVGEGAYPLLVSLRRKLNFETTVNEAFAQSFCIFDRGIVHNVTALLDKQFYDEHAMMEIRIRYRSVATDNVGLIKSMSGTGTLVGGATQLTFNFISPTTQSGAS